MFFYFTIGQQLPCGSTPISQSRVIGGQDAKPGAWPWQVQIIVQLAQQFIKRTSIVVSRFDSSLAPALYKGYTLVSPLIAPLSFRQRCEGLFYSVKIALSCVGLYISQMKFDI